ncbi:MAG: hypothetical protein AAFW73_27260, partial [Bacteroidota bacterium]
FGYIGMKAVERTDVGCMIQRILRNNRHRRPLQARVHVIHHVSVIIREVNRESIREKAMVVNRKHRDRLGRNHRNHRVRGCRDREEGLRQRIKTGPLVYGI